VFNDVLAHEDMLPTLMAAAGVPRRQASARRPGCSRWMNAPNPPSGLSRSC